MRIAYLYLAVPFLIFVFGWFKPPLAILAAIIILVGLFFALKHAPKTDISMIHRKNTVKIAAVVIIAMVWVYMSGIGGFAFQNYDHTWRNAVLEILVEDTWPVYIHDTEPFFNGPVSLVYYFAFWLPSACVGKLFGLSAAFHFLYFWSVIGILIVFYLITAFQKKLSIPVIIAFVFFSGLDIVGSFIYENSSGFLWFSTVHLENWAHGFQISSLSTQLFWVYNQAIPAWLITLMLLHTKDNRSLIFTYSFSLLFSTLPAIGLIPLVAFLGIRRCVRLYDKAHPVKNNLLTLVRETLTIQNVAAGGVIGITSYLFLKSNLTGEQGFHATEIKTLLMPYLMCVFFEFLVFYIAIYPKQSKNGLFWLSLATLLVVPLIRCGPHVDFVMRASIPSLVILFVLLMDSIAQYRQSGQRLAAAAACFLLLIGGITAEHEIMRSIVNTTNAAKDSTISVLAAETDLLQDGVRNNFFAEYEDSFFFKYIAKK